AYAVRNVAQEARDALLLRRVDVRERPPGLEDLTDGPGGATLGWRCARVHFLYYDGGAGQKDAAGDWPPMDSLRADRVSLLLARQLTGPIRAYYKQVDESDEQEMPADRVIRIELLEPLGLAIQMYCLFLRALECDPERIGRIMAAAWKTLELT